MRDMHRRLRANRQREVAPHALAFGRRRHAGDAQTLGYLAGVDRAAAGQRAILFVQRNRQTQPRVCSSALVSTAWLSIGMPSSENIRTPAAASAS